MCGNLYQRIEKSIALIATKNQTLIKKMWIPQSDDGESHRLVHWRSWGDGNLLVFSTASGALVVGGVRDIYI